VNRIRQVALALGAVLFLGAVTEAQEDYVYSIVVTVKPAEDHRRFRKRRRSQPRGLAPSLSSGPEPAHGDSAHHELSGISPRAPRRRAWALLRRLRLLKGPPLERDVAARARHGRCRHASPSDTRAYGVVVVGAQQATGSL